MCLYPKLIDNPKYKPNKKNRGNPPPVIDPRVKLVPIGCQNCIECRRQKSREWQVRLLEDIKTNKNARFITLTFSNEKLKKLLEEHPDKFHGLKGYDLDNQIATTATRLFLERWRKQYKKSLRHWFVTELGHQGTENIHLHGLVWTNEHLSNIESHWQYGYVWKGKEISGTCINYVNDRTVGYITKYVTKIDEQHRHYKSIILTSPGIGKDYTIKGDWKNNRYANTKTDEAYTTRTGHKISLPIYWRNKIYSDQERERLWLNRLDKNERWVCGERVSTKHGPEQYYKLLEYYRRINTKYGFGNDEVNWDRYEYEQKRRVLQQEARIRKLERKTKKKDYTEQLQKNETYYEFKHVTW